MAIPLIAGIATKVAAGAKVAGAGKVAGKVGAITDKVAGAGKVAGKGPMKGLMQEVLLKNFLPKGVDSLYKKIGLPESALKLFMGKAKNFYKRGEKKDRYKDNNEKYPLTPEQKDAIATMIKNSQNDNRLQTIVEDAKNLAIAKKNDSKKKAAPRLANSQKTQTTHTLTHN